MAQVVISVDVTVGNDIQAEATFHSVRDGQGSDITDKFRKYCNENNLPLNTQADIEKAATDFAEANKSWLP
ncbi:MAG: hypothetical protein MN733_04915 [Nitrososphaera sp.]|nr:hypothetical protein [Nitrososphaera sp.]